MTLDCIPRKFVEIVLARQTVAAQEKNQLSGDEGYVVLRSYLATFPRNSLYFKAVFSNQANRSPA